VGWALLMLFKINASLLIFIIIFQGLIFNITHYWLGISQANSLVQFFILLEVIFLYLWAFTNLKDKKLNYLILLILTFFIYLVTTALINLGTLDLQSVRTIFVYVFPFSMFYLGKYYRIKELMNFYFILFSIIVFISFLQIFSFTLLPDFLLYVPSLINPERTDQFYFGDLVLNRPNGLIGNPIEFSIFINLNIIALMWWISLSSNGTNVAIKILLACSIALVVLSLSRFAIALLLFNLVAYILFFVKNKLNKLFLLVGFLFIFTFLIIYSEELVLIDGILAKFDGRDSWANQSNLEHIYDYIAVYDVVSQGFKNILFGLGPGYNNKFDVITDGFHFILLIDLGIIGVCIFYLLSSLFLLNSFSRNKYKLIIALLAILFFSSGFVNSGYLNRTVAFIFWFILGAINSKDLNYKTRSRYHNSSNNFNGI
jgi:hypothetical protein